MGAIVMIPIQPFVLAVFGDHPGGAMEVRCDGEPLQHGGTAQLARV